MSGYKPEYLKLKQDEQEFILPVPFSNGEFSLREVGHFAPDTDGTIIKVLCRGKDHCGFCFQAETERNLRATTAFMFRVMALDWCEADREYRTVEKTYRATRRVGAALGEALINFMGRRENLQLELKKMEFFQPRADQMDCSECGHSHVQEVPTGIDALSDLLGLFTMTTLGKERLLQEAKVLDKYPNPISILSRTGVGIDTSFSVTPITSNGAFLRDYGHVGVEDLYELFYSGNGVPKEMSVGQFARENYSAEERRIFLRQQEKEWL